MSLNTIRLAMGIFKRRFLTVYRWKSSSSYNGPKADSRGPSQKNKEQKVDESCLPPEPTFCCMSGCSNCVWIKYAQDLAQLFDNGDVIAKRKISEKVHDPKLRAFLFTQLGLNEVDEKK